MSLEDVLKTDDEFKIQKYLERNDFILKVGIGVPEWAFNYVLPQFQLGAKYRADFLVVTGQSSSYEVTIVELKKPGARLYNRQGTISKDLNIACAEVDNYRRWINDNTVEFKKNLVDGIKEMDSTFEEHFDWTRRFHINSKVVIGRRTQLTREIRDKNFDMEDKGVDIISYDRLLDAEKRLLEMLGKGIDLNLFYYDDRIKNEYGTNLENKQLEDENVGTDNILFLGDEEQEYGLHGFYRNIIKHEEERNERMRSFYCILYDDEQKEFDVIGPISDDTLFTESVVEAQHKGFHVHCGTIMTSEVDSIEDLKKDGDPPGYRYHKGLLQKIGIKW